LGVVVHITLRQICTYHLSTSQAAIAACVFGGLISCASSKEMAGCSSDERSRTDDPYEREFWEPSTAETCKQNQEFESILGGMLQETEMPAPFHQYFMGGQYETCLEDLSDKYVRTPMVLLEELDFEESDCTSSPMKEVGAAAPSNPHQSTTSRLKMTIASLVLVAFFGQAVRFLIMGGLRLQDAYCHVAVIACTLGGILRCIHGREPQVAAEPLDSSNHICKERSCVYQEGFWHDEAARADASEPTSALAGFLTDGLKDNLLEHDMAEGLSEWTGTYAQNPMVLEAEQEWD